MQHLVMTVEVIIKVCSSYSIIIYYTYHDTLTGGMVRSLLCLIHSVFI